MERNPPRRAPGRQDGDAQTVGGTDGPKGQASGKTSVAAAGLRGARAPLTRERIVAAAFDVIDEVGLASFSTRKLGAALGVEAMSIYHYFRSKRHLMDALVDHALSTLPDVPPNSDPIARVRQLACDYRALAHRYPKFYPFLAVHRLNTPTGVAWIERTLIVLREATGGDLRLAAESFRAISYYLMGAGLDETSDYAMGPSAAEPVSEAVIARECPMFSQAARYFRRDHRDTNFAVGLEMLLTGIAAARDALVTVPPLARKPVVRPKH